MAQYNGSYEAKKSASNDPEDQLIEYNLFFALFRSFFSSLVQLSSCFNTYSRLKTGISQLNFLSAKAWVDDSSHGFFAKDNLHFPVAVMVFSMILKRANFCRESMVLRNKFNSFVIRRHS